MEYSATTGRLGLGLLGLEGEALLGLGALLARDHDNQLFLGLGRRQVWAEMARRTFNHLDFGDNAVTFGRRLLLATPAGVKSLPNVKELTWRAHTRARARLPGEFPLRKHPRNPVFVDEEGYPHFVRTGLLLFLLQSRLLSHSLASIAWRR